MTTAPSLEFSAGSPTSNEANLEKFFQSSGLSGDMILLQGDVVSKSHSANVRDDSAYNIASVGKIFTGVLAVKMIQEEVLIEDGVKTQPVELDQKILDQLPENIQKHLEGVTLHQLMTHTSGLTDHLPGYEGKIKAALDEGSATPAITEAEDYLEFAEDAVVKVPEGETRYSNLGLLLAGLAIQSAHNKKHPDEKLDYHSILEKYVLTPAKMEQCSIQRPEENSCPNPIDPISSHLCGGPAGGYWANAESLGNFGKWVCEKWKDPEFKRLTEDYGSEFYDAEAKEIRHWGTTQSISADLAIYPEESTTSVVLTNRPLEAFHANRAMCNQLQESFATPTTAREEVTAAVSEALNEDYSADDKIGAQGRVSKKEDRGGSSR
jgi:CubicO group peptidase (beta-lactamase class C family)